MITARNYAAHAVRDLRRVMVRLEQKFSGSPSVKIDAAMMELVAREMTKCPHFAIPDGGRILQDGLKGLQGMKVRLPYKSMTIEYYMGGDLPDEDKFDRTTGTPRINVNRRVLFVQERSVEDVQKEMQEAMDRLAPVHPDLAKQVANSSPEAYGAGGITVFACFSSPPSNCFVMHPVAATISFDWEKGLDLAKGVVPKGGGVVAFGGIMCLPWCFESTLNAFRDPKVAWRVSMEDMGDEVATVLSLCEALACSNVHAEPMEGSLSPNENRKRIASGQLPLYETKVLVVSTPVQIHKKGEPQGTHASPREHLRRGHIRVLRRGEPLEERIWVQQCIVNPGGPGRVDKTYSVIGGQP